MLIRLFRQRVSLRLLLPIIAFLFSAVAGITFAAWLDAPNAPPNYGIVGCTLPCEQEDFMPMNLSATPQTKRGSIVVVGTIIATPTTPTYFPDSPGNIIASGFYDSENAAYFLDPAEQLTYSGVFGARVGIRQKSPGASLAGNNDTSVSTREAVGKIGSSNDAIYAYANSANAAISAEQANPAGYAVYASGGINYFEGNVGIGTTAPGQKLSVAGIIESTSGGIKFPDGTTQTTVSTGVPSGAGKVFFFF